MWCGVVSWVGVWAQCLLPPLLPSSTKLNHTILLSPPNKTNQDILARFHRMRGRPTLWLPGTDHAGIATQMLVERALNEEVRVLCGGCVLVFCSGRTGKGERG